MADNRRAIEVELAELRRRAYGPDADIAADPAAQSRLRDLEAGEQEEIADVSAPRDAAGTPGVAAPPNSRWRRSGPWIVAGAAITIALLAGAALVAEETSRPQAELTLAARSVPGDVIVPGISTATLRAWNIPPGALAYNGRVGNLDVWTMTDGADAGCVILSVEGSFYRQSCGRRPLAPQIDVVADPELIPSRSMDPAVPPGSVVRIGLFDDVVRIFVARPDTGP
ncbi:hypothetical protein [Microbacterium terricola]|uniref:Uncharacterized protein n=1 Tax=Microbacterium terricola TaxID=344163 RepID=A0ABM8E106_9MICO|nr:hypothetical protein [Microbacterium terricola]UYK40643.1 hypothetical protein OAU46_03035 [Microbacterium terricola]BDV31624.1 hypothetical protein Microterr_22840 [Microbacterium terricola]